VILVDRARRRAALKRGGGAPHVNLDDVEIPLPERDDEELLAVDEALEHLAALWPRKAELVKLRYFAGMTFYEAASALGIAAPTAKEWWRWHHCDAVATAFPNGVGTLRSRPLPLRCVAAVGHAGFGRRPWAGRVARSLGVESLQVLG
jgi:ECF sigma factor